MAQYHNTEARTKDGKVYRAGDVVRLYNGAFSDAVILGFDETQQYAKLARPYAYASCVGTTGPTSLVGTEIIQMYDINHLDRLQDRGRVL